MAFTSVWRCVWMQSCSQEWWNRSVNNFTKTGFIQIYKSLAARQSVQTSEWHKSGPDSNMTVQTEAALQKIRPESGLGPHIKVA